MNLRVGPYVYRVRQVHGLIDHEGEACLGLCDNQLHELLVSDQASTAQQIQVLCHEYIEAWIHHFGQNLDDKEDYCDLFGLAMTQFVMDYTRSVREEVGLDRCSSPDPITPPGRGARPFTLKTFSPTTDQAGPSAIPPAPRGAGFKRCRVSRLYQPPVLPEEKGWVMRVFEPVR